MTMYDPDNPQHIKYLEEHRKTMDKIRPITPPGPIKIDIDAEQRFSDMATRILRSPHPETDLIRMLKHYDARIAELIKYNSEQVIRRREINAHRMKLLEWVVGACKQFRFYAAQHREKVPKLEGLISTYDPKTAQTAIMALEYDIKNTVNKSKVNDDFADAGETAMTWESEPGGMGRP